MNRNVKGPDLTGTVGDGTRHLLTKLNSSGGLLIRKRALESVQLVHL